MRRRQPGRRLSELALFYVTFATRADAEQVAETVLAEKLAACANILALEHAGVRAKLYPGSWSEWASRGLPVERG